VRTLLWTLFAWSARAQPAAVVAGTTGEGDALASVRLVGEGSARHYGGGHDRCGRCTGLSSFGRRGIIQPLRWRERQVRGLFLPLFAWSAWAQPATVVAGTSGEGASLATVRSIGVGSASHCGGGHDRREHCSGLYSFHRRRLLRALLWPLFALSWWAQPATVMEGTTGEGAGLDTVRSVVVDSASHCGGGNYRRGRCSGLCSLGRRGHSQLLRWRARQLRELLWLLIAWSAGAQAATLIADTTVEGAVLESVRFVGERSASHFIGGHDR
jgi:hypothetical protein